MASASSMGEADAKFPHASNSEAIPPSPTRENPAAVYPKSDPSPAPSGTIPGTGPPTGPRAHSASRSPLGNPFLLRSVLDDLDASVGRAIDAVRSEAGSSEGNGGGDHILSMFEGWRAELDRLRAGQGPASDTARVGSGETLGAGIGARGRTGAAKRPEEDPSSAESGGMFAD